ncbi:MAG TPA: HAMP domain-containing sensor histidine kinase [Longimicrobiales bacterium]
MSFALTVDERLSDVVRAATRGHADYALVELRDGVERHRAVSCSARADAGLVAALRAWQPDAQRAQNGTLARVADEAVRKGSARLLRQLDPSWLGRELQAAQLDLLGPQPPRSALVLPIAMERGGAGMLLLFSLEPEGFDADAIEACAALARLAAASLERDAFRNVAALSDRAREDFLSIVSHELRSPLTTIIGYADLLKTGTSGSLNEIQRAHADRIVSSAWELVRDLERILELVRAQQPDTEPRLDTIELAAFTSSVARIAEPIANEKGLDFRIVRPESRVELVTDPDKLRRALLNLLHNAVRYTRSGWVALESETDGNGIVCFRVRDTGVGISRDVRARMFQPFGRAGATPGPATGLGLGLTLARQLVRQLQGDITVESEAGTGSIFTVRIPRRLNRPSDALPLLV